MGKKATEHFRKKCSHRVVLVIINWLFVAVVLHSSVGSSGASYTNYTNYKQERGAVGWSTLYY